MNDIWIMLGSNLGWRHQNLEVAHYYISKKIGEIIRCSGIYETEPWGFTDQKSFLNQALHCHTGLSPSEAMEYILDFQSWYGNQKHIKYGPRTIDIDLLLYRDLVVHSNMLSLPHPRMHKRNFVLIPLAEIAGPLIHPVFGLSINQLRDVCQDSGKVHRLDKK